MTDYLLDTSVISEPKQKRPNPQVISWLESQPENKMFLSVITIGEIKKGITRLEQSGRRRSDLDLWLGSLRRRFTGRILTLDIDTLLDWGQMLGEFEKKGIVRPAIDSLLEATALNKRMALVTRNVKNFQNSSVQIVNPWDE
ncbi:MAG TPA: type II toxin-antitoxin system VapC family toxin [Pyrinomonadaceae bacterium]|jgi:predicted nucleic acid-binding protein